MTDDHRETTCTRWPRQQQTCHKLMPAEPHNWCQPCTDWVEMDDEVREFMARDRPSDTSTEAPS